MSMKHPDYVILNKFNVFLRDHEVHILLLFTKTAKRMEMLQSEKLTDARTMARNSAIHFLLDSCFDRAPVITAGKRNSTSLVALMQG